MGKNKFDRAKEFLNNLKEKKGDALSFPFFLKEIKKEIGMDETRTVKPYLKLMLDFRLIEQQEDGTIQIK